MCARFSCVGSLLQCPYVLKLLQRVFILCLTHLSRQYTAPTSPATHRGGRGDASRRTRRRQIGWRWLAGRAPRRRSTGKRIFGCCTPWMSSARRQVQLLLVDGPYMLRLSASKRPGDGFCSWTRSPPPTRSQPGRLSWRRMRTISGCGSRVRRLGLHAVAQPKVGRRWSRPGRGGRRPWGTSSRTSYSVTHVHRRPPGRANGLGRRQARLPQTLPQLLGDSTP